MPVSLATQRDPFRGSGSSTMRVPQARVLRALVPPYPEDPQSLWPALTRAALGIRAGYTAISGTVTRALNGVKPGATSTLRARCPEVAHLGLINLGLIEVVEVDVDGSIELNYRITATGLYAYRTFIAQGGVLPPVKEAADCTNDRYKE